MDDRLSWKHHIFELRRKLNKSVGIIFKMKKLCPQRVLISLYYALVYSHLSYGICVWGNADDNLMEKVRVAQKKVVRILGNAEYLAPTSEIFKSLNILNLDDIFLHQYACIMWDQDHGILPKCFKSYFKQVTGIHTHDTRMATSNKLSENIKVNTKTYGEKMFKFKGPKVLNPLKDLQIYNESKTKVYFRKKYKNYLLSNMK